MQIALAAGGLAALSAACQDFAFRTMAGWERAGFILAGLLMIFLALVQAAFGDAVPAPHLISVALGGALLARRPGGAGPNVGRHPAATAAA